MRYFLLSCLFALALLFAGPLFSQVKIHGTVFDITQKKPLEGVNVRSTSGNGTATDILGRYTIPVDLSDSIYFSYLGRITPKFAVKTLIATNNFDVSLQINSNILPEVIVRAPTYQMDSLQNRKDYAKIFNYTKPGLSISSSGSGVGLDMDELINIFRFKKKKNTLAFQERLVQQEQDKFVDHRFNKGVVRKITNFSGDTLDMFMKIHRPSYEFATYATDYDFYEYIKERAEKFTAVFLLQRKEEN